MNWLKLQTCLSINNVDTVIEIISRKIVAELFYICNSLINIIRGGKHIQLVQKVVFWDVNKKIIKAIAQPMALSFHAWMINVVHMVIH